MPLAIVRQQIGRDLWQVPRQAAIVQLAAHEAQQRRLHFKLRQAVALALAKLGTDLPKPPAGHKPDHLPTDLRT